MHPFPDEFESRPLNQQYATAHSDLVVMLRRGPGFAYIGIMSNALSVVGGCLYFDYADW
jgi:hypothetical protein